MHNDSFIPSLTSIRGIASFYVLLYHINITYKDNLLFSLFNRGDLGVDLFFLLSGFIMAYVYGKTSFKDERFKSFYVRFIVARISRVYPLHLFTLLFLLLIVYFLPGFRGRYSSDYYSLSTFISNLFLIQNWGLTSISWNIVSWSISAEWFMYLLFPFMLFIKQYISRKEILFLLSISIISTHYLVIYFFDLKGYGGLSLGGMIRVFFEFSLGFVLYFIRNDLKNIFIKYNVNIGLIAIFLMVVSITFYEDMLYLFLPAAAITIVHLGTIECRVSRFLSKDIFLYFGNISFSLYMWHWIVINIHNWFLDQNIINANNDISTYIPSFSMIAISILIAHYSYLHIEKPARRWGRKFVN